jgi:hypothetical protein
MNVQIIKVVTKEGYKFQNMHFHSCYVRFQVLTTASMKLRFVFWDVLPYKLIVDRRFRGTCCLHHRPDDGGSTYL